MKIKSLPLFIGVITSLIIIGILNKLIIENDCVQHGGMMEYKSGKCLLEDGSVFQSSLTEIMLVIYFVIALVVSLWVSKLLRKLSMFSDC